MDCSTPGFPVHHQLLELAQTHVHWAGDAIQPSHPLSSPFPPVLSLSQHQGLFQLHGFSSGHVWMRELDYKESWAPKNWCFWAVVLETTLESPLGCKEIQPIHPKGNQSWILIGRTDAEAEILILWPADDSWKDWGQEEKGTTEGEMVGWHHRLNGHGFVWTLGIDDGQGGLACCGSWGRKQSDMTEWLNWIELNSQWTEF